MGQEINPNKESIEGLKGLKGINFKQMQQIAPQQIAKEQTNWRDTTPINENIGTSELGKSIYDQDITTYAQTQDLENTRGELQPGYAQIGAGVAKMGTLAATTFVGSTLGLVAGIGTAIGEGRWSGLWDNAVSNTLYDINAKSEELFKNYYTNEEKNNHWYDNIFTANFLGDKILKNMGFTIGAIGAGALTGALGTSLRLGSTLTKGIATGISAIGEGSVEALNTYKDQMSMTDANTNKWYEENKNALDIKYQGLVDNLMSQPQSFSTVKTGDGRIVQVNNNEAAFQKLSDQYHAELKALDTKKQSILDNAKENALVAGNQVLALNIPLLAASDLAQFGRVLSGGYANAAKGAALAVKNSVTGEAIEGAADIAKAMLKGEAKMEASKGFGKELAKNAIKNAASEGFEEGSQNLISNTSQINAAYKTNTFAGAKVNAQVQDNVNSYLSSFGQALHEQYGSVSSQGWEETALGALSGLIGVPMLKKGKNGGIRATWAGGITEAIDETKEHFASNEVVDEINRRIQSPEFINKYQGLIRHNHYADLMKQSIENKNEFDYKNSEAAQLVSDILMFRKANQLDAFKQFHKSFLEDNSDEAAEEAKAATQIEGTNVSSKDGEEKEKINQGIQKAAKGVMDATDRVAKIHDEHLAYFGDTHSDDALEELTWLKYSIGEHETRFKDKLEAFKTKMLPIINALPESKITDKDGNKITDILNTPAEELLASIISDKSTLNQSINLLLKNNADRYKSVLEEIKKLEKDKKDLDVITGRQKEARQTSIGNKIESLNETLKQLDNSGLVTNPLQTTLDLFDALASAAMYKSHVKQYNDAIQDPSTLENKINEDKTVSGETTTLINRDKDIKSLKDSKNIHELRKNLFDLVDESERDKVLDELSKEDSDIGKYARNIKEIDSAHKVMGDILMSDEFKYLDDDSRDQVLAIINKAYSISKTKKAFENNVSAMSPEGDPIINVVNDLMASYNKNKEESTKLNTKEKAVTKNPKKVKSKKKEVEEVEETLEEPTLETEPIEETPEVTPDETPENKPKETVDTSKFTIEDTARAFEDVLPKNYLFEYADSAKEKQVAEELAELCLTGTDEELLTFLKNRITNGHNLPDELFLPIIKEAKEYYQKQRVNKEDEEIVPQKSSPEVKDEVLTTLDNANADYNVKEVRSDGVTEYEIFDLNPNKEGNHKIFGKGKRGLASIVLRLNGMKTIITYLKDNNVFEFVNSGKLFKMWESNKDLKIHFLVDKNLNNTEIKNKGKLLSNMVLLAVEHPKGTKEINGKRYQIVGTLKTSKEESVDSKFIADRVLTQAQKSSDDLFISDDYTYIDKIYPGRIATSGLESDKIIENEERNVSKNNNTVFGVVLNNNTIYAPHADGEIVQPTTSTSLAGTPMLLIKAADGKYYPSVLTTRNFHVLFDGAHNDTELYQRVVSYFNEFLNTKSTHANRLEARDKIMQFIHFGRKNTNSEEVGKEPFTLTYGKNKTTGEQFVQISRIVSKDEEGNVTYEYLHDAEGNKYSVTLTGDNNVDTQNVISMVSNAQPIFNFTKHLLNDKDYAPLFIDSGMMTSNLLGSQMYNANFRMVPLDINGKPIGREVAPDESNPKVVINKNDNKLDDNAPVIRKVKMNGQNFTVDSDNVVRNKGGKIITNEVARLKILATLAIQNKEGILKERKDGNNTLYSLFDGFEEYGAYDKNGQLHIVTGEEYTNIITAYDTHVQGDSEQIKKELENTKKESMNSEKSDLEAKEEQSTEVNNAEDSVVSTYPLQLSPTDITISKQKYNITLHSGDVVKGYALQILGHPNINLFVYLDDKKIWRIIDNISKQAITPSQYVNDLKVKSDMIQVLTEFLNNISKIESNRNLLSSIGFYKNKKEVNNDETTLNDLDNSETLDIFADKSDSELLDLADYLEEKGHVAASRDSIQKVVKQLLDMSDTELASMTIDGIISKLECL